MSNNIGFRVFPAPPQVDPAIVEGFRGIPSSNIGDEMNRMYNMHSSIKAMNKISSMAGTAFTVKVPVGDNLMFHRALDMARPGDVLVVDGQGCMERSLFGEIMTVFAWKKGIAGIVVDGCLRDIDAIREIPMPVYAKGVTPQGPYKNGPGEIGVPVCCGGQVVGHGDLIVGDSDGVVVIRPQDAPALLERARAKLAGEEKLLGEYRRGMVDYEEHARGYGQLLADKGAQVL